MTSTVSDRVSARRCASIASRLFGWAASLLGVAFATGLGGCAYGPPSGGYDTETLRIKGTVRSRADKRPLGGVLVKTSFARDSTDPALTDLDTTAADGTYQVKLVADSRQSGVSVRLQAATLDPAIVPHGVVDTVFPVSWESASGSGSKDTTVDLDLDVGAGK